MSNFQGPKPPCQGMTFSATVLRKWLRSLDIRHIIVYELSNQNYTKHVMIQKILLEEENPNLLFIEADKCNVTVLVNILTKLIVC